ncbi:DNA-3-methyladenine glycosylase I [Paraglaciecola sp. L1A13]|uniref:DNA-3-methyladenine glycosylase I n=1 Tax=Paraglaciecola sp. L1A13 TaxID=2686359 RepID=UPI00131E69F9|nr:DNA-3-methyladenine glycosylase I [Paraglaciecola sp. L1A13]|tara:strand:+ start:76 stop:657 length:582 start_codon:yes stop_codon:yes gene_type:complete
MHQTRCAWVSQDPIYQDYHDNVWGRPVQDKYALFAKLCLDGQQAGLSWLTILKKQQNYYQAFHNFDPLLISVMTEDDVERLLQNKGIVRNRLKINAIIKNAKGFLEIEREGISFADYIWSFVNDQPTVNAWVDKKEVPTTTSESDAMSKALKKRGFSFVGSTICYAFMQAVGLVNDHTTDCFCYPTNPNASKA